MARDGAAATAALRAGEFHVSIDTRPRARAELASGWPLLVAATVGSGTGASSLIFYSLGVFVAPLQAAFGWTRGDITSAMIYSSAGLVLAAPVLGWLIDRAGERRVALASIPCFAAVVYALSLLEGNLTGFYLCFFLAAVLGCGTTPILYTRAVASHFDRARGLALGITLAGPGTAAIVLPPFLVGIIGTGAWRQGFQVLALIALVSWPLVWCWLRSTPATAASQAAAHGISRRAALGSRVYWTLALTFALVAMAASALVVHMVPMLKDAGLDAAHAARVASVIGIGIILGRLLIGWIIDRLFAPRVAAAIFAIAACGCVLLAQGGPREAPVAAFLIGFALGAEVDLMAYLTSRYFGLRHYGFLYGTVYSCFWIGIASGPAIAGWLFDATGGYAIALWAIVGLFALGALAALSLPRFEGMKHASPA